MVSIPRRKFKLDIEGKIFEAKELSTAYLMEAMNGGDDTADLAVLDSIGVISDEDLKLFGAETKNALYTEIVKFTYSVIISKEDLGAIQKFFNMKEYEVKSLSSDTQYQLKSIIESRNPRDKGKEKKNSPS